MDSTIKNLCVGLLVFSFGCGASVSPNALTVNEAPSQGGETTVEPTELSPTLEDAPEANLVPRLMSQPSGDERLTGILGGTPAPFSGILLNDAAAAWLEAEPDAVQERCQAFVDRRVGELRARLLSEVQRLSLRIETIQQVNGIELRARDQRIESLLEMNETLRNSGPGEWWENVLWVGGALLVGIAGGLIAGLLAI